MELPASSILIIAGMHRSGTSLTASLLQQSGLHVGEHLVGAAPGNPRGHFENVDFMEFHRAVLRSNGIDPSGWTVQPTIALTEQQVESARQLVLRQAMPPLWGWKDPRTTLFLDFWADQLPTANFLLLVRAPWEVVDSLFRRGLKEDAVFAARPSFALEVWQHYNRLVLNFWQRQPHRCVLAACDRITQQPAQVFDRLREQFGLTLADPANLYDRTLLHTDATRSHHPQLIRHCAPEAIELYESLLAAEATSYSTPIATDWHRALQAATDPHNWAFQDWWHCRHLEATAQTAAEAAAQTAAQTAAQAAAEAAAQTAAAQAEVDTLQQQLSHLASLHSALQAEFAQTQQAFYETQAHFTDAKNQLDKAHVYLNERYAALTERQAQLEAAQTAIAALEQTQAQLQAQIQSMEASRFWQLRQAWMRLRTGR